MTVAESSIVDFVGVDPLTGEVFLSMVEERDWGREGELLPDLQAKLNTYLEYVESGQLKENYPDLAGARITFRLHFMFEPGAREREFIRIVVQQHLNPRRIGWEQGLIGSSHVH